MKTHFSVLGLALLFAALPSCGGDENRSNADDELRFLTNPVPDSDTPARMELWRLELMKADRTFDIGLQSASLPDWAGFFSPDGSMVFPGMPEGMGPDGVMDAIWEAAESKSITSLTWSPEDAQVSASGELGYTEGRYQSTGEDSLGVPVLVLGRYLTIWRHQEDGSWTVERFLGTPTAAPQPMPESGTPAPLNPDAWRGGTSGG